MAKAQHKTQDAKANRGTTGLGFLYKRGHKGEKLSATSKANGVFWLRARWADGKTSDRRLLDEDGNPIRSLQAARAAQRRLRAPFLTGSRLAEIEAQVAAAGRLRERQASELDMAVPPLTIKSAWAEYIRTPNRRQCSDATLANYRLQWGRFQRWLGQAHPEARHLRDVTEAMAEEYAAHLTSQGGTANTYNKHITLLRSIFRLLRKPGRLAENPFAEIQRRRQVPQSRRTLTLDELRAVVQTASGELRTLLEIGIYTGLRLGDCCTLQWSDVDLGAGVIRRTPRKTRSTTGAVVEIGMAPTLVQILSALPRDGQYVLPQTAERYLRYETGVCRAVMAHLKSCGLQVHDAPEGAHRLHPVVRVSFHSLRHTWVSLQTAGGTPPALVQKAAGHSNPQMTEHYTHIGEAGLRMMASAAENALEPPGAAPTERARLIQEVASAAQGATVEALKAALAALTQFSGRAYII